MSEQDSDQPECERFIETREGLADAVRRVIADPAPWDLRKPEEGDIVISPSQIMMWQTCRLKWWLLKVAKVETKPALNLRWGSALHKILEIHNKGATKDELFETTEETDSQAFEVAYGYLQDVVDEEKRRDAAVDLAEIALRYVERNPERQDQPEEDYTVYLFTIPKYFTDEDGCPHDISTRVFLRGITDFKMIRQTDDGPQQVLGDYKTAARRWPKGKNDRESAPSFYALREYVRHGSTDVPLVHEIILKKPAKCKGCRGKGGECEHVEEVGLETCDNGKVWYQRFLTERDIGDMHTAALQIAQFAISRIKLGDDIDLYPPSTGYDQMNCGMCDVKEACWIHAGLSPDDGGEE